jgi:hypothetical protein
MMMRLEYVPGTGFIFDGRKVEWGTDRDLVRGVLGVSFEEENRMVDLSEYFEEGERYTVEQRRDFYHSEEKAYNFYLNYDDTDRLSELEVHSGLLISVNEMELQFESDINPILVMMNDSGEQGIELEEGNYLFRELRMTVASSAATGGEGSGLAYFYAAESVEHLLG